MIVTMAAGCNGTESAAVVGRLQGYGFQTHQLSGAGPTVIGANGRVITEELIDEMQEFSGVDNVNRSAQPYMLAQRAARPAGSLVRIRDLVIGGPEPVIMAGTCSVEDRDITIEVAHIVKNAGGQMLRGGAFKPRTSPYSFQGLGEEGLQILAEAREETGLAVVTEAMEPDQVDMVAYYADMIQIGSRNMANFSLLRKAATAGKPILLKRGFSATVQEWLMSAEYILAGGNDNLVLCERGIRGFDTATRFTLDLNAVPLVQRLSHLPIIVDPSHGTGIRDLVKPMSLAGIAAGAHGLIIELHPDPDAALSDGDQSVTPETYLEIMDCVRVMSGLSGQMTQPVAVV